MAKKPADPAKPTQKEAVKQALAAGKELPADGVAYIKGTFGMELSKGAFSTLKTQLKKVSGAPAKPRGLPAPSTNGSASHGIAKATAKAADLVRALRPLIATFGAEAVKDMADALAE